MSWSKLDDKLFDHKKLAEAGECFGPNGEAIALGLVSASIIYCNKHETDGYLAMTVVRKVFRRFVDDPLEAARVMCRVRLWERVNGGFQVHDFLEYNFSKRELRARRRKDLARKRRAQRAHRKVA